MTNDPIRDRGLGPEIVGTRITVYNLLPHFVDSTATESSICRMYDLTRHLAIKAKMAARNPPEIIERAKQTHAAFLSLRTGSPSASRRRLKKSRMNPRREPTVQIPLDCRHSGNGSWN